MRPMRVMRHLLNPASTAVTRTWCHSALRRSALRLKAKGRELRGRPWPEAEDANDGYDDDNLSPAGWVAPPGTKPGWNWLPPDHGVYMRRDLMPMWVRAWYRLPLIDRYAYVWMWHHRCWELSVDDRGFGDLSGVREPRRPLPTSLVDARDLRTGAAPTSR